MKSLLAVVVLALGCGSDPVDAEGTWTVSGTNRTNDCMIANWNVGDMWSNVTFVLTQNGSAVNGDVTGVVGGYLDFLLGGTDIFSGTVDGNDLDLQREGTRSMNQGNCTWTYNAELLLSVSGDLFTGRVNYVSADNGNSDCAAVRCLSYQDVNGTRPPQ
jgi:hypothetical protein